MNMKECKECQSLGDACPTHFEAFFVKNKAHTRINMRKFKALVVIFFFFSILFIGLMQAESPAPKVVPCGAAASFCSGSSDEDCRETVFETCINAYSHS